MLQNEPIKKKLYCAMCKQFMTGKCLVELHADSMIDEDLLYIKVQLQALEIIMSACGKIKNELTGKVENSDAKSIQIDQAQLISLLKNKDVIGKIPYIQKIMKTIQDTLGGEQKGSVQISYRKQILSYFTNIFRPIWNKICSYVSSLMTILKLKKFRLAKLNNIGNSCYLNTAVKCIMANMKAVGLILSNDTGKAQNEVYNAYYKEFIALLKDIITKDDATIYKFKIELGKLDKRYNNSEQNDCFQAMVAIIDNLHKATKINEKQTSIPFLTEICNTEEFPTFLYNHITKGMKDIMSNRSLFYDLFLNVCYIQYTCPKCGGTQVKMEINSGIPLEIVGKCNVLNELINAYFKSSIFEDYTCKICKKKVNISVKRNPIIFAPVLVFHIKRIIVNPQTGCLSKTNKDIYYPIDDLDIKPFFSDLILNKYYNKDSITQYSLTSIGIHMGNVKYGHYLTYLFNPTSKKWESHNDSMVNNIHENEVLSNDAIVLTYTRKDLYSSSQIYNAGQAFQRIIDANPT